MQTNTNTYINEKQEENCHSSVYQTVQLAKVRSAFYLKLMVVTILLNLLFLISTFGQITIKNALITNTASITINGSITSETGTVIQNNGTISVGGDFTNNSSATLFGTSQGTVDLTGSTQNSNGSFPTVFHNLNINNSNITLNNDITIDNTGTLNVGNGKLDLNSNILTINNNATNAITSSAGYIVSEASDNSAQVKWKMDFTAGSHVVPFGNAAGIKIPLNFDLVNGDAGVVTFSTYPTTSNNLPLPVSPVPVSHIRDAFGNDNSDDVVDRFWQIDVTGSPVAALTFNYANSENASNGNTNMRAQRWNMLQDGWDSPSAGQFNWNSQSATVNNVTAFGVWTLSQQSSPLPIKLLYFDAKPTAEKEVICTWATATETDNDYYTIERSKNGHDFEVAGVVDGSGTTVTMLEYSFTDEKPYSGVSYYRLKQTDYNGDFSYSKPVAVKINEEGITMQVFPNPASDFIQISSSDDKAVQLTLMDPTGKIINIQQHQQFTSIDISNLAPGIYFLVADDGVSSKSTFRIKKI